MGLPMVGKGHQRKIHPPETASRRCCSIPNGICGAVSGGRSSANHQQPSSTQQPSANYGQNSLGTLYFGGTAPKRSVQTRCLRYRGQELDPPPVGPTSTGGSEDRGGRALAARYRSSKWNQGQDQERDVGI